jgi:hypothetical protein
MQTNRARERGGNRVPERRSSSERRSSERHNPERRSQRGARLAKAEKPPEPPEACPICEKPTLGSTSGFGTRLYCATCSGELAGVLEKTRLKKGMMQTCKGCRKVASSDGGLMFHIANVAYCKHCVARAQPLIESMVRQEVTSHRTSRRPFILVAAILLVVSAGGAFGMLHASEIKRAVAGSSVAKAGPTDDGKGAATALLDAMDNDLAQMSCSAAPLSSATLQSDVSRLEVVTTAAGGGSRRSLVEYALTSEHHLERRLLRWVDGAGQVFENAESLGVADHVVSFRLEREGTPLRALHATIVLRGANGPITLERDLYVER